MEDDQSLKGDKLVLRGLKFHGFHGVKPEERKLGQKFVIDVDAWLDLKAAGISDDLSDTVSYTDIYQSSFWAAKLHKLSLTFALFELHSNNLQTEQIVVDGIRQVIRNSSCFEIQPGVYINDEFLTKFPLFGWSGAGGPGGLAHQGSSRNSSSSSVHRDGDVVFRRAGGVTETGAPTPTREVETEAPLEGGRR
ncbi:hypothetical protein V2J09_012524 [Rumex salicifolius]